MGLRLLLAGCLFLALAPVARAGTARLVEERDPRAGDSVTLQYRAGPGEVNQATLTMEGPAGRPRAYVLEDTAGIVPAAGCDATGPTNVRCRIRGAFAAGADLDAGDADDEITVAETTGPVLIDAGAGDDVVRGGGSITGGPGNDTLTGGPGGDVFLEGGTASGSDTIAGGPGGDQVSYRAAGAVGVQVDLEGDRDDGAPGENDLIGADVEHVDGSAGDDTIAGNDRYNSLAGRGGSDVVDGRGGDDAVYGNIATPSAAQRASARGDSRGAPGAPGRDRLSGGPGADLVVDSRGPTKLDGGAGRDRLESHDGADEVSARDGALDSVLCTRRTRVRADALDFTERRCRRVRRDGAPRPVPLRTVDLAARLDPQLSLVVGCPSDSARACGGSARLFLRGRRLGARRFSIAPGQDRYLAIPLRRQPARVVTVRMVVRYRDQGGRLRHVALRDRVRSES